MKTDCFCVFVPIGMKMVAIVAHTWKKKTAFPQMTLMMNGGKYDCCRMSS